jgi:hypothetical protein
MNKIVVIDDFFETPMLVRNFALTQKYNEYEYVTGFRTVDVSDIDNNFFEFFKAKFCKELGIDPASINSQCSFQYSPSVWEIGTAFHIHKDPATFSAMVFLYPDPPDGKGTAFYKLDETKRDSYDSFMQNKFKDMIKYKTLMCQDIYNISDIDRSKAIELILEHDSHFLMTDYIGNKFNRCIIWPSDYWHDAFGYFGNNIEDSRMMLISFNKNERSDYTPKLTY